MNKEELKRNLVEFLEQEKENKSLSEFVGIINEIRESIHNLSPFKNEPVDFVKWIINDKVKANDYNPNKVAPPEMQLLEVSIDHDGYTQPIVTWPHDNHVEVIDGFHRHRVGKESEVIRERVKSFLPTVIIRSERANKKDRIASTIRHNRARGKHTVSAMSEIVLELKNRNWRDARIARELGMDEDEILRLCQISGLEDIFKDDDFSRAWSIDDLEDEFIPITDEVTEQEMKENNFRTANTSDPDRIFHTYDKWECVAYGFFDTKKDGFTKDQCEEIFAKIVSDEVIFRETLEKVTTEWKYSCEHYLTNKAMNRIAWLGQACAAYYANIPSKYKGGFHLLSEEDQKKANLIALEYLNIWLENNGLDTVDLDTATSAGRQVEIY